MQAELFPPPFRANPTYFDDVEAEFDRSEDTKWHRVLKRVMEEYQTPRGLNHPVGSDEESELYEETFELGEGWGAVVGVSHTQVTHGCCGEDEDDDGSTCCSEQGDESDDEEGRFQSHRVGKEFVALYLRKGYLLASIGIWRE